MTAIASRVWKPVNEQEDRRLNFSADRAEYRTLTENDLVAILTQTHGLPGIDVAGITLNSAATDCCHLFLSQSETPRCSPAKQMGPLALGTCLSKDDDDLIRDRYSVEHGNLWVGKVNSTIPTRDPQGFGMGMLFDIRYVFANENDAIAYLKMGFNFLAECDMGDRMLPVKALQKLKILDHLEHAPVGDASHLLNNNLGRILALSNPLYGNPAAQLPQLCLLFRVGRVVAKLWFSDGSVAAADALLAVGRVAERRAREFLEASGHEARLAPDVAERYAQRLRKMRAKATALVQGHLAKVNTSGSVSAEFQGMLNRDFSKTLQNKHCSAAGCAKPGLQLCGGCKAVRYCGPICQKRAWKDHKADCKRLASGAKAEGQDQPWAEAARCSSLE
jgi:hypothetical protein